jgi:hypothetical protein
MRSYVTRTAATPAEVINIMSPVSLHPNHRESYPVAMRSRTSRIGLDFYDRDQMGEPAEGTMAVSILLDSHLTLLGNLSLSGS